MFKLPESFIAKNVSFRRQNEMFGKKNNDRKKS